MLRSDQVAALNLAQRPLVNRRPLRRAAAALWFAAAVVVLIDAWIVVRHVSSSSSGGEQLVGLERQIEEETQALRRLNGDLRDFDLEEQNVHVEFLNGKIAQRTFPWSRLFDQLGDVLPEGVRLESLRPLVGEDDDEGSSGSEVRRRRSLDAGSRRWVQLQISGQAETDEAILELVDGFFGHPAFSSPNLRNEAQERGLYRFNLSVRYLPDTELEDAATGGMVEHVESIADEAGSVSAAGGAQ